MKDKAEMIDAEDLDRLFDEGKVDVVQYFDVENAVRLGNSRRDELPQKVSISLPNWMLQALDEEAEHIGVTRQAVIKLWLNEKISPLEKSPTAGIE